MNHGVKRLVWLAVLVMLVFIVLAVGFRGKTVGTKPAQETQAPAPAQTAEAVSPAESGEADVPAAVGEISDDEASEPEVTAEHRSAERTQSAGRIRSAGRTRGDRGWRGHRHHRGRGRLGDH